MKSTSLKLLAALVSFASLAAMPSAQAAAANSTEVPAPFFSRIRGGVEVVYDKDFGDVTHAVSKAIDKLKFTKIEEKVDALVGMFRARTADDKKITIRVVKVTDTATRVIIQVGLVGDDTVTRALIERIKTDL